MSATEWSDVGVSEQLPTGTVTLLLADVEGFTRLWEALREELGFAIARLDAVLGVVVAEHHGVRPGRIAFFSRSRIRPAGSLDR
jgi:class 3 adenylate cyclase